MATFTRLLVFVSLALGLARPAGAQTAAFATGTDISWVTQMEASNYKFYTAAGTRKDLFQLLCDDYHLNTVRLRVWVHPADGWSGKADVLAQAGRAHALSQRLLLDFHYSDSFADPGQQTKPAAWQGYPVAQLKQAVYDHTADILTALKTNGITPEWVQVGNETNDGMLWPEGRLSAGGGFFRLTHYKATAYQVRTYQLLTSLPNGTYTLSNWVMSGGGQNSCQFYANGFGGAEKAADVPQTATWTQLQIPGIAVTNGQCEIGLHSDANAGSYCSLDDVTFTTAQALATAPAAGAPAVQLYPNPAAGPFSLAFDLAKPGPVRATLLALTGQLVRVLADAPRLPAGPHVLALGQGPALAPGVYRVRLQAGGTAATRPLLVR